MKHTPGPWESYETAVFSKSESLREHRVHGYGFGDNGFICDLDDGEYHEYTDYGEMEANANLIAAAPDLLAACERMIGDFDIRLTPTTSQTRKMARAAIAKARGNDE